MSSWIKKRSASPFSRLRRKGSSASTAKGEDDAVQDENVENKPVRKELATKKPSKKETVDERNLRSLRADRDKYKQKCNKLQNALRLQKLRSALLVDMLAVAQLDADKASANLKDAKIENSAIRWENARLLELVKQYKLDFSEASISEIQQDRQAAPLPPK